MSRPLSVAVVGNFQLGKSTLVNCLLSRNVAETGKGKSTTHRNASFPFGPCEIIDTPGFDAKECDDKEAEGAIRKTDILLCVHESKPIGSSCPQLIPLIKETGKKFLFLLNTMEQNQWSPDAGENGVIAQTIEAELSSNGLLSQVVPIDGVNVTPVNLLWARFGLGLLDDEKALHKIARIVEEDLGISATGDTLREIMLDRSGFLPIRDFLKNLPLELLKHDVMHPEQEINRIVDRFAAELKKRWNAA